MRIAMVSEHASPLAALGGVDAGGQNVHVLELSSALADMGHQVTVWTRRDDDALPDSVPVRPGVFVRHVHAGPARPVPKDELVPYLPAFTRALDDAWTADPPDIVHAHFWMSGMVSLAAAAGRFPVVQTFHALGVVKRRYQGDKDTSPPERLDIERDIVRQADEIVATCSDEMFELLRLGGDVDRVKVVPCGVDLSHFSPEGPVEASRPGLARLVVVSRLVERKGVGNVVTALADVPGAEVVIAGGPAQADLADHEEARRLMGLAEAAGVADRVELRGRVDRADLPALLRSADAVLCVPWYEPFGIVALEAMACGVPVVATAVGGLVDTVVDGVTGIHVPPRSPQHLAAALRSLLEEPVLRRRLGTAGARRARRRYGWNRVARSTLSVYGELLCPAQVDTELGMEARS